MDGGFRRRLRCVVFLGLTAASPASLGQDYSEFFKPLDETAGRVGMAGDASLLRITGAKAFTAEEIRAELQRDITFQAAVRPTGDLVAAIDALGQRVEAGYWRAGYFDARVRAGFDCATGGLFVEIVEGQQYVAGDIRVEAAGDIDAAELIRRAQRPVHRREWTFATRVGDELRRPPPIPAEGENAAWQPGKPIAADLVTNQARHARIMQHAADMGFPFAHCTTHLERVAGTNRIDLVLTVDDSGPRAVLREVRVEGLTRHTPEQLQAFLGVQPGSPLDSEVVERIRKALRDSCRFWTHELTVVLSPSAGNRYGESRSYVDLEIKVVEYDHVPPLGEPLPTTDACLARAAAWLEAFGRGESTDELAIEQVAPGWDVRGVLSSQRGAVVRARVDLLEGCFRLDHALVNGPEAREAFDWLTGQRLRMPDAWHPQLSLAVCPGEVEGKKYGSNVNVGLGLRSHHAADRGAGLWSTAVEPVTLVHDAHREGASATLSDGVLTVTNAKDGTRIRIDQATGAVLEATGAKDGKTTTVRLVPGEFDRLLTQIYADAAPLEQVADAEAPWTALGNFLLNSLAAQPCVRSDSRYATAVRFADRLWRQADVEGKNLQLLADLGFRRTPRKPEFLIPMAPASQGASTGFSQQALAYAPRAAAVMFPHGSWPWTVVREFAFSQSTTQDGGQWRAGVGTELQRVASDPATGPLSMLAMTHLSGVLDRPAAKTQMARASLARFDETNIRDDVALLVGGEHGLARLVQAAILACDDLDSADRAVLTHATPEPWRDVVAAVLERRASHPEEPPDASLEAALAVAWNGDLREHVRAELESMASPFDGPHLEMAQQPADPAME